jgi:hypothetical protein
LHRSFFISIAAIAGVIQRADFLLLTLSQAAPDIVQVQDQIAGHLWPERLP